MGGAAEHVEDKLVAKVDGVAFGINFELFAVSVLGEPTNGSFELSGN